MNTSPNTTSSSTAKPKRPPQRDRLGLSGGSAKNGGKAGPQQAPSSERVVIDLTSEVEDSPPPPPSRPPCTSSHSHPLPSLGDVASATKSGVKRTRGAITGTATTAAAPNTTAPAAAAAATASSHNNNNNATASAAATTTATSIGSLLGEIKYDPNCDQKQQQQIPAVPSGASSSSAKANGRNGSAPIGTFENPHRLPMNYIIGDLSQIRPELRQFYKATDGISSLIPNGHRTATTRQPPRGVKVGDCISFFPKCEGIYRVEGFVKVNLDTPEGVETWSKREGWSVEAAFNHGPQVSTGRTQMLYSRVDV